MSRKKPESVDFEKAMSELEAIVARLEQGELTLEESLRQFERGVNLTRACQNALKTAEQRIEILVQPGGPSAETTDFEPEDGDSRA